MRFLCWIGIHRWYEYWVYPTVVIRHWSVTCTRCGVER